LKGTNLGESIALKVTPWISQRELKALIVYAKGFASGSWISQRELKASCAFASLTTATFSESHKENWKSSLSFSLSSLLPLAGISQRELKVTVDCPPYLHRVYFGISQRELKATGKWRFDAFQGSRISQRELKVIIIHSYSHPHCFTRISQRELKGRL